jgi:hypothetical protein
MTSTLGFRSAVIAGVAAIAFSVTALFGAGALNILPLPWDPVIPDGASFVLALAFMVMMACIHHEAAPEDSVWSLIGLAFAILYVADVTIVYVTIITFTTPSLVRAAGGAVAVAPFVFDANGSFMSAVDGLGYFFQSMATLLAAFAFVGMGSRWLRRAFVVNGIIGFAVLLAYMPLVVPSPFYQVFEGLAAPWIVTLPLACFLAARHFRRAAPSDAPDATPQARIATARPL